MTKRITIIVLLLLSLNIYAKDAVTYPKEGGRFGDRLIAYIHAKWISFQEEIPLLYHPFPYSEFLALSQEEIHLAEASHFLKPSQVHICPYFPESEYELREGVYRDQYFHVDYKNQQFIWLLRKMIAPTMPLNCIMPPKDRFSIAIHVREGGGYDPSNLSMYAPHKSPPFCFYTICLNKVLEILDHQPIFCFIFTDAKEPSSIVQRIKNEIPENYPITFHYRESNNSHANNVLEDFFSFQNFDILIRPDSNFSLVPSLLHRFAIVCSPVDFGFDERGLPFTKEVSVRINSPFLKPL